MKTVPILVRGLALSSACLLFACSGTQAPGAGTSDATGSLRESGFSPMDASLVDASLVGRDFDAESGAIVAMPQDPQDPSTQDVNEQRLQFLINDGLARARQAMQLHLHKETLREAAQVLDLAPDNEEARTLLLAATEALGDQTAKVTRTFDNRVLQARISLERDRFRAQQLAQTADAEVELGRFGDAIDNYEKALLILELNPLSTPGSELQQNIARRLEIAQQQRGEALQEAAAAERARSQRDLEEAERRKRLERDQRVARLLVQANRDFQLSNFRSATKLLEQAIALDPNNQNALALLDLSSRANTESKLEVARQRWKEEWTETFQDLDHSLVPQSDTIVYDLARWAEVSERSPLSFTQPEGLDDPEERAILAKLENTKLEHNFGSAATLENWAAFYQRISDVIFVITPSARDLGEDATTLEEFRLPTMSVAQALDVIQAQTGVKWHIRDGVVELVDTATPTGKSYMFPYEVRDIVNGVRNRPGPKLKLTVPGEDLDDFGFDDDEPAPTVVDDGRLQDLIRNNINPDAWDEGLASMSYNSGALFVRAPRAMHGQIEKLLNDLRRAIGIQVDIEARFLRVEDSFLEDVGVDFRGLGDQSSEGVPGRGLEQNNRSNLRFDDFGRPEQINTASPGQIGTGTEPGFFYDDGGDGDIMGRTEHLYDSTLGGGPGELDNSGGLALQYAFLDDTELEVILRAVQKTERSEIVVAPRLLVYNNTRAHMQALRHTSYIRDFDVEIAQAAAVANPIVDVVNDGVVLDVRPVVSADRRFITMELRPTVMELQLPIPTFTTTLGTGQPVSIQLPDVTLQSVRTTVTMPDGGTLLLGGMKLAERRNQVSGIPILSDIPLISFFFSRKGSYVLNRKIIILIRATIIMNDEWEPTVIPDSFETLLMEK